MKQGKMRKQNAIAPAPDSDIDAAITTALTYNSHYSAVVVSPKTLQAAAGKYIRKRMGRKTATPAQQQQGDRVVDTWVKSLRDSSPTRIKFDSVERHSWAASHPSALDMFDEITRVLKGKQIVMFLDYDGTLSPIVADPDRAFITNEMREAVRDVASHFPTAIVTGRCKDKVYSFVKLAELYYAGSHGMDIQGPASKSRSRHTKIGQQQSVLCQPASEFLPIIDEVYKILVDRTKSIPGARVENNRFCLSVHFRCVDEQFWEKLAEQVKLVLNGYPKLALTQGRKVLEIRPSIKWDKGKALEFLLHSLGYANSTNVLPVYIGDDRTDEDAFKVLRQKGQGLGILVSKFPRETKASYSLQEPAEVKEFLRRLVEWKRLSIQ